MSEIKTPIKTINGHALVDTEGRELIAGLSEEIEALKPETRTIATIYGAYDSSFNLIGVNAKVGIRTEILTTSEVKHARLAKDWPAGYPIVVYYDLAKNPVKRVSPSETAGSNLLTTFEYPYFDVEWYHKSSSEPLTSDEFLSLLDIMFKANDTIVRNKLNERKYAFPKWADIHPWVTFNGVTDDEINSTNLTFADWYNRFHSLVETYPDIGLEEINMSTEYLAANTDDAIPEAITSLTNGGLYMWHLPAPAEDGAGLAVGHYTPKILILSGVHGDERDSVWCVWKLLDALCLNDAEHRAITLIRNFCDIYIVPMVNPYGLENRTRANENQIDINRDFNVKNWAYEEDDPIYPTEPNSQYSTRCVSWWISKVSPNLMVDYHRSEGDTDSLPGMLIQWGTSPYKSILSIVDENINDITPYVRKNLAPKFDAYHHRFGHAKETLSTGIKNGTTTIFASELGIPAATYELVRRVRWNGVDILTSADAADICAMNYHGVVNFLVKFVQYVVDTLNSGLDWKANIDW